MSLDKVLKKAVERIHSGSLENEAQVKQAVILPILRALDWDDSDPAEFVPEFSAGNGRVDYALLRSGGGPLVFIEAKGLGGVDAKGEEQVFRYAVNRGVPFLILTDGKNWDFYLGQVGGGPADQLFHQMELAIKEEIPEYIESLQRYLRRGRIVPRDSAVNAALKVYQETQEKKKTRDDIPLVWRKMLETSNQKLRDLLVKEIKKESEPKLKLADVKEEVDSFLRSLLSDSAPTTPRRRASQSITTSPSQSSKQASASVQPKADMRSKLVGFILDDERFETGSAKDTLAGILKKFQNHDPDFMERLAEKTVGRTNRLVARNRNDLFTNPKFVEKSSLNLENGWWLGHHLSTKDIQRQIETACEVAGVEFGSQLKLIER